MATTDDLWFFLPVNPEPWAIGPISVGKRNGKFFPVVGQNAQMANYKEAIAEELSSQIQELLPEGQYSITFYVWRVRDSYQGTKKKVHKNQVDATNIQKATEDALQGILFGNDRDVRDVRTVIVEQGDNVTPGVVVHASMWSGLDPSEIPDYIWSKIDSNAVEITFDDYAEKMHSYSAEEPELF